MDSKLSRNKKIILIAVKVRTLKYVKTLMDLDGLEIHDETYFDYVLLKAAFERKHKAIINFLLQKNCRVKNINETNCNTPLHHAIDLGDVKIISRLLRNGASISDKNNNEETPFDLVIKNSRNKNRDEIIKEMFPFYDFENVRVSEQSLVHFHTACEKNIQKAINNFVSQGFPVNGYVSLDSDKYPGYTTLHLAVKNCHENIVDLLLNHGADVSVQCKNGLTPLHLSCQLGKVEISNLLLNFHAGLTSQDNKGRIPLHCAFYKAPMDDLISLLLAKTPKDVNHTDSEGLSIFHIACTRNNIQIVEHFLKQGVSPNLCTASDNDKYPGYTPIHFAVEYNRKAMVQLLLKYGADAGIGNSRAITPLHMSCIHSHKKFYELYEHQHSNWTSNHKNHIDIVELLLKHKVDVNSKDSLGKTPLLYLCQLSDSPLITDTVEWQRHVDKNTIFETESYFEKKVEVEKRMIDITHILLRYNADVNACTCSGESVLHVISKDKDVPEYTAVKLAKLLLQNKANVQIVDYERITPLHIAVKEEKRSLIALFLNYNADINAKTVKLMTPLHVAAASYYSPSYYYYRPEWRPEPIVNVLLINGCNVDDQDVEGKTALHHAMSNVNYPIIEQLLRYGANINCEDACGHPPVLNLKTIFPRRGLRESTDELKKIIFLLDNHIEKLQLIGLHTNDKSKKHLFDVQKQRFPYYYKNVSVVKSCEIELEKMKRTKVDQYTNLYNILFKDDVEMTRLVKNENLKKMLTDDQLTNFPHYGDMLKLQFRRGTDKIALLDDAKESLRYMTGFLLPDSCSERIFRYLTNNDLSNLIKVKLGVAYKRKINVEPDEETIEPMAKQTRSE